MLDPDTYTLRYVNMRTRDLVPDAEPGKTCYEAFYKRESPCENCVLKKARANGQSTMELYNHILGLWVLADASIASVEPAGGLPCVLQGYLPLQGEACHGTE